MDLLAPKDPQERRKGFYVLLDQKIGGEPTPDGAGRCPIFLDGGRLSTQANIVGGISDAGMLRNLASVEGFRQMVYSIGVSVQAVDPSLTVDFTLVFYGSEGPSSGSRHHFTMKADGVENVIPLSELPVSEMDLEPGQFLFELPTDRDIATAAIKFYLHDGFDAPDIDLDGPVDRNSQAYREMIARSFLSGGNNHRVKRF